MTYAMLLTLGASILLGIPGKLSHLATLFIVSTVGLYGFLTFGSIFVLVYIGFCIYWWFVRKKIK